MPQEAIDFHWSPRAIRRIELLLVPIAALGLPILWAGGVDAALVGAAWIAVFLTLLVRVERHARSRAKVITVDASGLFDRRLSRRPLGWEEIERFEEFEAESMTYVGLRLAGGTPRDALKILPRLVAPLQRAIGLPPLSISMSLLDGSASDLMEAIDRVRPGVAGGGH